MIIFACWTSSWRKHCSLRLSQPHGEAVGVPSVFLVLTTKTWACRTDQRTLMTSRSALALTSQPSLTAASTAVSESDAESASVQEGARV